MPGICGLYLQDTLDHSSSDFSTQTGITPTVEKDIHLSDKLYIRQYIIPKFQNDKLFVDTDDVFISTDGWFSITDEIISEYGKYPKSELFPLMFRKDGKTFMKGLRGDFSGVVVDKVNNKLHLFTNHIGSKRLFYYYNHETRDFFFASDLKIVTTLMQKYQYKTELSEDGAYCLLTFGYMLRNLTLCKDVYHLEPGTILTLNLNDGTIEKEHYYELKSTPYIDDSTENIIKEMDRLFCQAIKREYDADCEYGYEHIVTLSGGLDSRMTLVKGIMAGYDKIHTLTFSQSGYLDHKISQQIAEDLNCDYMFHALDNGNYLMNLDDAVKANDGLILYSGAAHQLASVALINWDKMGLLHTGMIGDLILGSYLKHPSHDASATEMIKRMAYSSKHLDKVNPDLIDEVKRKSENDELCAFNERCINGVYNGYFMTQNYSEYASPFLDIDFLDYVMHIHPELRYNNKLYEMWIHATTPIAEKYIWEATGAKLGVARLHSFINRGWRYVKGKYLHHKQVSMNPFEYWFTHNKELVDYFDSNYQNKINNLNNYNELMNDTKAQYESGTVLEKAQVLTLCQAVSWLELQ